MKLASHLRVVCWTLLGWTWLFALSVSVTAAVLSNGTVHPKNGDLATVFKFSVTYLSPASTNLPQVMHVILDESITNVMSAANPADLDPRDGKMYTWSGTLPKARHRFRFAAVPPSVGDIARHAGPDVSDAPLLVRPFYFFLNCPADYLADDFYGARDSRFISAGDLNGDGHADLAHSWFGVAIRDHADEGAVMVYYGPDFARSDFDDLVIGNSSSPTRFFVYHGRASGPPVLDHELTASGIEEARALADVNQDGHADLVSLGSATVCYPPGYNTVLLRVRSGPALNGFNESTMGVSGSATFAEAQLSVVDRNGDGHPGVVMGGALHGYSLNSTSGTWHASSDTRQIRCADGPGLGVSLLYSKSAQPGHSYDLEGMLGIGDANGDGNDDFAGWSEGNWWERGSDWYTGPSLNYQSTINLPAGSRGCFKFR